MNINIIGLVIGFICGLPYLFMKIKKKSAPELIDFGEILLSCIGIISVSKFGFEISVAQESYLGNLADQRITIVLGAVVIVWISINTLVKVYLPFFIKKDDKQSVPLSEKADTNQDVVAS